MVSGVSRQQHLGREPPAQVPLLQPGKVQQTGGRDLKPSFIMNFNQHQTREQVW